MIQSWALGSAVGVLVGHPLDLSGFMKSELSVQR